MTPRYTINEMPFPLHDRASDARTHWAVTDNKPECEAFNSATGAELHEEKPPPFRHVAYCAKRGHAEMIAGALNKEAHPLMTLDADGSVKRLIDENVHPSHRAEAYRYAASKRSKWDKCNGR